jgi:putative MATE family efflux protein
MNIRSENLGTEKISKLLLSLSLPSTIAMMVNSLYNIIDTMFVGQGVGADAIGGLAIAFPVQMITMGLAQMIGLGAASAVSRNLGAGNIERADEITGNAYVLITVISTLYAIIGLLFTNPLLTLFGATPNLLPYASEYMKVIFLGSVFFSLTMTINNLIQAEGNAKIPMISTLLGGILNILLDPVFIFVFDMGIAGAAWATVVSQIASFIFVITYLFSGKSTLKVRVHHLALKLDIAREIFAVGSSAFARSATNTIFSIVVNNSLKIYGGDLAIIIFGIINRVIAFLFLPVIGVVQGMQPIVGYNYGAKKIDRVKEVVKVTIIISTAISVFGWIIGQTIPHLIIRAFTADQNIIERGSGIFRIMIALIPFLGIQMVGSTLFQSLGKAIPSIILSLLRQFILLTPLILILPRIFDLGLKGVWLSFPLADIMAVIITVMLIKREMKKIEKEQI